MGVGLREGVVVPVVVNVTVKEGEGVREGEGETDGVGVREEPNDGVGEGVLEAEGGGVTEPLDVTVAVLVPVPLTLLLQDVVIVADAVEEYV